jgi:hypothetical protein
LNAALVPYWAALLAASAALVPHVATANQFTQSSLDQTAETPTATANFAHSERDVDRLGWYVPDFFKIHVGGYAGLIGVGVGYSIFGDVLNVALLYGFVPEVHAGVDIHTLHSTLALRPFDLRFGDFRSVPVYVGEGLLYVIGDRYFVRAPDGCDSIQSCYRPTALHWTAHLGTELDWLPPAPGFFERHGAYVELTTFDTFIFGYLENRETVAVTDAVATGFGYRAAF